MTMRLLGVLVCLAGLLCGCGPAYDGAPLWRFEMKKAHMQWAVADEQRLYLCADDVYCLDIATGRLLWEFATFGTHASAPVIADGRLFFQCGGLYALDAVSGSVLWEFWTNDWAAVSPALEASRVYAPVGDRLYCLDAVDGKRVWSIKTGPVARAPVVLENRIFFSTGKKIFCADGTNGQVLWRFDAGSDRVQLARGGDYLLSVGFEGLVRAHRVETGAVHWQLATNVPLVHISAPDEGCLLISAGRLYCVNPESGVVLWTLYEEHNFVRDAYMLGRQLFARTFRRALLCVAGQDGSVDRTVALPAGGQLLTDGSGAVFIPAGKSRIVTCRTVSAL